VAMVQLVADDVPPGVGSSAAQRASQEARADRPRERAGLQKGDVFRRIDCEPIDSFAYIFRIVSVRPVEQLAVKVERQGPKIVLNATPASDAGQDSDRSAMAWPTRPGRFEHPHNLRAILRACFRQSASGASELERHNRDS
jgi:hypothetical protein